MPVMTSKSVTVAEIADHAIMTIKPHESPRLIMWRELVNSFNSKDGDGKLLWRRDDKSVHEHFKKFGPSVIATLERRYRLTIVKVGGSIRRLVNHGGSPDRGGRRTDAAYRICLAGPSNPTMGFVAFPRDTQQDHPLVIASRSRGVKAGSSHLASAIGSLNSAKDLGTISGSAADEIRGLAGPAIRDLEGEGMPLFYKPAALPA